MAYSSPWNDSEVLAELCRRWREGVPAGVIATELSRLSGRKISRGAVMGKLFRLGLTKGDRLEPPQRSARPRKAPPRRAPVLGGYDPGLPSQAEREDRLAARAFVRGHGRYKGDDWYVARLLEAQLSHLRDAG